MTKNSKSIHGLPAKSYTDQQFWEIECNTVLADGWLFVGFVHEFSKPGDAIPISVAGKPILIIKPIKSGAIIFGSCNFFAATFKKKVETKQIPILNIICASKLKFTIF